jgi:ATP-dependent exoDNAse (exonuclease V) beta subunit
VQWLTLERTVRAVSAYKNLHGLRDFTDLLEEYAAQGAPLDIRVAFVDEAQDLSPLQWRVLRLMLAQAERVYIAGDDDQAIYRWSGADVDSFLGLGGEQEILRQSWRCSATVHALADKVVHRIKNRIKKTWAPRAEQGSVEYIQDMDLFNPTACDGSVLMLARNTYMLGRYVSFLTTAGVPFLHGNGFSSVTERHVRGIQAWEALRAGRFIDEQDARLVYDLTTMQFVKRGFKSLPDLAKGARVNLDMLRAMHGFLGDSAPWYEILRGINDAKIAYYRAIMRRGHSLKERPSIQLQTIHGVKGGEADTVVLAPDMARRTWEGYEKEPDDEHRVSYVGVSRARKNLIILPPMSSRSYPYQ